MYQTGQKFIFHASTVDAMELDGLKCTIVSNDNEDEHDTHPSYRVEFEKVQMNVWEKELIPIKGEE